MNTSFIKWADSSSLFSSQVGIQVFQDQQKVQFTCVERGVISRIVSAIAEIFGTSTSYGIHLAPNTSSISLETANLKKEIIQEKVSLVINKNFNLKHTPITKESANQILNELVGSIYKSTFSSPSEIDKDVTNESKIEPAQKKPGISQDKEEESYSQHTTLGTLQKKAPFKPKPGSKDDLIISTKKRQNVRVLRSKDDMDNPSGDHFDLSTWKKTENPSLTTLASFQDSKSSLLQEAKGSLVSKKSPSEESPSITLYSDNTESISLKGRVTKEFPEESSKISTLLLMGGLLLAGWLGRGAFTNFFNEGSEGITTTNEGSEGITTTIEGSEVPATAFDREIQTIRNAGQRIKEMDSKNIFYTDGSVFKKKLDNSWEYGVLEDKNGNIIREGKVSLWNEWVDGFGTVLLDEKSLFTGPIRDGMPCGSGIKKSNSGEEEYVVNGYGKITLENGEIFIGDLENHLPSGYGEIHSKDGALVKEGIFHGSTLVKEILTLPLSNTETFRGEIDKEGQPHGFGVVFSEQGISFGKFDHGKLIGDLPKAKSTDILLFSSYTPDRAIFNKDVIDNHKIYSEEKGYHYVEFVENLAKDFEKLSTESEGTTLPYWSKIAGMLRLLNLLDPQKFPEKFRQHLPKEFVWLDDDAVMTKRSVKMEDVIKYYAPEDSKTHIFLTQDILHERGFDLNTAVLFVRNSPESRSVFSEIWSRRFKKAGDGTYATCPNQSCLHEQAALQDLVKLKGYNAPKYVRVIPQRDKNDPADGWGINTFHRASHEDTERRMQLSYDLVDPIIGRWKKGDFIGQATGMAKKGYLSRGDGKEMNLRELFIQELVESEDNTFTKLKKIFWKSLGY